MIVSMPHLSRREFEQTTLCHRKDLYRWALRATRRIDAAEDLVQDTYLRAFRAFHTFERGTNARAWLFRILKNAYINQHRARAVRPPEVSMSGLENVPETATAASPEAIVMGQILPGELHGALGALPEAFRRVVELACIEEMSYQEIADVLDVPIGTVMSRLHRGRKMLERRLRPLHRGAQLVASA